MVGVEKLMKYKIGLLQVRDRQLMLFGIMAQKIYTELASKEWLTLKCVFKIEYCCYLNFHADSI